MPLLFCHVLWCRDGVDSTAAALPRVVATDGLSVASLRVGAAACALRRVNDCARGEERCDGGHGLALGVGAGD